MLKANAQPSSASTREQIVDSAFETLRAEGFAGASARSIARRGGFNQALIFYYFGTLADLLLAALDRSSEARLARYREATAGVSGAGGLIGVARELYREDLEGGHITVLNEMIGGSLSHPELGPKIVERMAPWIDLAQDKIAAILGDSMFAGVIDPRSLAFVLVSLYLGVDLVAQLDEDRARAEELFEAGERLVGLMGGLTDG